MKVTVQKFWQVTEWHEEGGLMAQCGRWRVAKEKVRNKRLNEYRQPEDVVRESRNMAQGLGKAEIGEPAKLPRPGGR